MSKRRAVDTALVPPAELPGLLRLPGAVIAACIFPFLTFDQVLLDLSLVNRSTRDLARIDRDKRIAPIVRFVKSPRFVQWNLSLDYVLAVLSVLILDNLHVLIHGPRTMQVYGVVVAEVSTWNRPLSLLVSYKSKAGAGWYSAYIQHIIWTGQVELHELPDEFGAPATAPSPVTEHGSVKLLSTWTTQMARDAGRFDVFWQGPSTPIANALLARRAPRSILDAVQEDRTTVEWNCATARQNRRCASVFRFVKAAAEVASLPPGV